MILTDNNKLMVEHAESLEPGVLAAKVLKAGCGLAGRECHVYFLAWKLRKRAPDLLVRVNGHPSGRPVPISPVSTFRWYRAPVPKGVIKTGKNRIEFVQAEGKPDDWRLGITSCPPAHSYVSLDGGESWSNRWLGRFRGISGEYVVRLAEKQQRSSREPRFINEKLDHPGLREIRGRLPVALTRDSGSLRQVKRLSTWIARRLRYANLDDAFVYTPWNFWQILRNNDINMRTRKVGGNYRYVVMCVQFAVAFVQAALALGLKGRYVVAMTADRKASMGHFFSEIWLPRYGKWILVDPNCDTMFFDKDIPLSAADIHHRRNEAKSLLRIGPGWKTQKNRCGAFMKSCVETGDIYANIGYWRRNDFLSHPEELPTDHGSVMYCEPDIVWTHGDAEWIEAFPYDCRKGKQK